MGKKGARGVIEDDFEVCDNFPIERFLGLLGRVLSEKYDADIKYTLKKRSEYEEE